MSLSPLHALAGLALWGMPLFWGLPDFSCWEVVGKSHARSKVYTPAHSYVGLHLGHASPLTVVHNGTIHFALELTLLPNISFAFDFDHMRFNPKTFPEVCGGTCVCRQCFVCTHSPDPALSLQIAVCSVCLFSEQSSLYTVALYGHSILQSAQCARAVHSVHSVRCGSCRMRGVQCADWVV